LLFVPYKLLLLGRTLDCAFLLQPLAACLAIVRDDKFVAVRFRDVNLALPTAVDPPVMCGEPRTTTLPITLDPPVTAAGHMRCLWKSPIVHGASPGMSDCIARPHMQSAREASPGVIYAPPLTPSTKDLPRVDHSDPMVDIPIDERDDRDDSDPEDNVLLAAEEIDKARLRESDGSCTPVCINQKLFVNVMNILPSAPAYELGL